MLTVEITPWPGAWLPEIWLVPPQFAVTGGELGVVPATALVQAVDEDTVDSRGKSD